MAKKGAAITLWRRSTITMMIIIILGFGTVIARLVYLQVYQSEDLQKRAVEQQLHDTTVSAKRGNIYDCGGNVLAQSITAWDIVLAPAEFKDDDEEGRKLVAEGLSEILGIDKDDMLKKTHENSYYVMLKRKADAELKDKVLAFSDKMYEKHKISGVIQLLENYKRYYTHDNFAGALLGFVGDDNQGLEGIEYQYNEELNGNTGRIIIAQDAQNNPLPYQYEQKVEATDGYNIVLTIDENIQAIMEKYVRETIKEFKVSNRGCAILMRVKTGEILGFACEESYDPNDPYTIKDKNKVKEIEALPKDKQGEARSKALNAQWRNKGISDTYVPGSVFKMITASAVLSEGKVKPDEKVFECDGSYVPYDGASAIPCWQFSGHGQQNIGTALCNSCNPAFMQMGNMLGREKFYEYFVAFGFAEKTGVDLPGESNSVFFNQAGEPAGMSLMDLAVASFGQNFKITPIQMITACSAIANKGKLMQPYIVSQIVDGNGNVVKATEPIVKRQAISENVASQICSFLETNAKSGGATNGYVAGYRIGGKTGTSQKIVDEDGNETKDYIASFCGIAPCDDPEIALLCYFDTPDPEINYYGSAVAGPCFRNIMTEVLPYLGIEKVYADDELSQLEVSVGTYDNMEIAAAKKKVEQAGLKPKVVGSGKTVIGQNPAAYSGIPKGGTVVLYTDEASKKTKVKVPDFRNCSLSDVNYLASANDLNVCIMGSATENGQTYAKSQDIAPNTEVEPFTVVTVVFNQDNSIM